MITSVNLPQETQSNQAEAAKFTFRDLNFEFKGFHSKQMQENLYKWGMSDRSYMLRFSFDQYLHPFQIDSFLLNFFNDPVVNSRIRVAASMDRWGTLGKVRGVEKVETAHSVTLMSFFDRLTTNGIVRQNGEIKKCLDEYVDGFIVSDHLRKCLLQREDESFDLFSEQDRKEFIFHLFKAICLGGKLCQYEDSLQPYLDATKLLYKDLICVTKEAEKIKVASIVFKINSIDSSNSPLFPMNHPQNFCYLSIDPIRRHVNFWYHASDVYYQ